MLSLGSLDPARLSAAVSAARTGRLTAPPELLGMAAAGGPMRPWFVDRTAAVLGHGAPDFDAAVAALRAWAPFDQRWLSLHRPDELVLGAVAGVIVHVGPIWSTNLCRVTDLVDTPRELSFTYTTVAGHGERGAERFTVTIDDVGVVRYGVLAVSRPAAWYTLVTLPYVRALQRRFRAGSVNAMRDATRQGRGVPGARA